MTWWLADMLYPQAQALAILTSLLFHRLPSVMAKNLSVPLAFACLLHLANEKVSAVYGVGAVGKAHTILFLHQNLTV